MLAARRHADALQLHRELTGQKVLLVDDVFTTGAQIPTTVAHYLLHTGHAGEVRGPVLARVPWSAHDLLTQEISFLNTVTGQVEDLPVAAEGGERSAGSCSVELMGIPAAVTIGVMTLISLQQASAGHAVYGGANLTDLGPSTRQTPRSCEHWSASAPRASRPGNTRTSSASAPSPSRT